jgi:hypothetical protein
MRSSTQVFFALIICCVTILSCKEKPPISNASLKVISLNPSSLLFLESGKLSEDGFTLFSEIERDSLKCSYTFILNPVIVRPDLLLEKSISTKIEKSGVSDITNPNVVGKLLKKNLQELNLPETFFQKSAPIADSLYNSYISSEGLDKDSILILVKEKKIDSFIINNKAYKAYSKVDDVRTRISYILCQNPKATITLLVDPPSPSISPKLMITSIEQDCQKGQLIVKTSGGDGTPITYSAQGLSAGTNSNVFTLTKNQLNGKVFTFIAKQGNSTPSKSYTTNCPTTPEPPRPHVDGTKRRSSSLPPVGNLTIIKGTEGCEVCTRYYSAVDATGRMHEIRERNSTNCCPCNKTIEMRGRTYLMNCDGSPHLELVD